jgi:predicted unusual protein kinase regulating ubiquinone biosynthesis (AarF/ABC1/UbiB family)
VRFFAETQVRLSFQKNKPAVGKWMREELASLGPAYIKLGQFLSTRPDIVGKDVVSELELLQDDVRKVPFADIAVIIDATLSQKGLGTISDVFEYIKPDPIASASIGQVHKARLRGSQTDIVIKVQKPYVASQIRHDLATLKDINVIFSKTGSSRSRELNGIVTQYESFLSAELDFDKERANMKRFIEIMSDSDVTMRIPRVMDKLSSSSMIVMEYLPSIKINDVETLRSKGINTSKVADTLIQAFLYQVINAAYVHCDPHPGNIGIMDDGETLVLYDYGNVIELSPYFKDELNQIVFAMYQKDADEFVDILIKLNILNITKDTEIYEAKSFFMSFFNYLDTLDFSSLRSSITNGEFTGTLESKLKLDADFFSLIRVFSLLDGTCAKLDPKFNYIDAIAPFADDLTFDMKFMDYRARKDFNKVRGYPNVLQSTNMNISRMQGKMKQIEEVQGQVQGILALFVIVDHWSEPFVLASLFGIAGAWAIIKRKDIEDI